MKATDFRDAMFEALRGGLNDLCAAVYEAWVRHGPGTTREVAARCGMDILTFRPRTTDLLQSGLVRLRVGQERSKEGVYEATPAEAWEDWRDGKLCRQQMLI